jgi:hypothetical protein
MNVSKSTYYYKRTDSRRTKYPNDMVSRNKEMDTVNRKSNDRVEDKDLDYIDDNLWN